MPIIHEEQPISEKLMCEWIAGDPQLWLGEPMDLRVLGGPSRPDLVGLDAGGRPVVMEVKQETVWELGNKSYQHVSQVVGYAAEVAQHPQAFGLPHAKVAIRSLVVGQLVDGSARAAADQRGVEWREVIKVVPGRMPSRCGHPKSTQWQRFPKQGAVMVHLMEEFPGSTRPELALKMQVLKRNGVVRFRGEEATIETCRKNVNFWTGKCPEGERPSQWWYIDVTSDGAGDSPMVSERYHLLDPHSEQVTLVWDDGTPRKTTLPDECKALLEEA
jgi:hypothetical protein